MTYSTPQENLWVGSFGDEYVDRNKRAALLAPKLMLLARIIERTQGIRSILEFGANIGLNQIALKSVIPSARQIAIEINEKAFRQLEMIEGVEAHLGSILSFDSDIVADLSFTSALLIHINPDELQRAYDILYKSARCYIAMIEYYNHEPIEVMYKGNAGCLFKRDWAGDMLTRFPDLRLVDYGFVYRRDPNFPIDDVHWFLLEKVGN